MAQIFFRFKGVGDCKRVHVFVLRGWGGLDS